jgi:hypothetical protein
MGWFALVWSCALPGPGIDRVAPVVEDADSDGAPAVSDCDENDAAVHPSADERCNGIDDNCDGVVDDDAVDRAHVYTDADWDGFGVGEPLLTCAIPTDALVGGDCDDADSDVHPGACEHPADGVDTNCDGTGDSEIPVVYRFDGDVGYPTFQVAETGPVAVRVVGSWGDPDEDGDERVIHVTASKPMVLVLYSWDPTHWTVDEAIPGTVQRVILTSGFGESTVAGIDAPVDSYWGDDRLFDYYDAIVDIDDVLFRQTGIHLTSRSDCETFDEMTLSDGDVWPVESGSYPSWSCPPDDTPFSESRTEILPEECHALVVPGTPVCVTAVGSWVFLLQPDGDYCKFQVPTAPYEKWRGWDSAAWLGDSLYFCSRDSDAQLIRLRWSDLEIQRSFLTCDEVTDWEDQILVRGAGSVLESELVAYGSWADVNTDSGELVESEVEWDQFMAAAGDVLYWLQYSMTSSVQRSLLTEPSTTLDPIPLEGFDGRIAGLDVTDDGDILVLDGEGYLRTFDGEGHEQSAALIWAGAYGLACFTP